MKDLFITTPLVLLVTLLGTPKLAPAQESIIEQMITAQESLVDVHAINTQVRASGPRGLARDPVSGRIIVARQIERAALERAGAGVILDPLGIIVTNAHVVSQATQVAVTLSDQTTVPAEVIRVIHNLDLAYLLIQPPHALTATAIADSDAVQLGDEILTIGSSPLLDQTLSGGRIIGLGRSRQILQSGRVRNDLLQTTINLYAGDSGGPLFDREGRLIGLMTAKETSADHSSFAIPSNQIAHHLAASLYQLTGRANGTP